MPASRNAALALVAALVPAFGDGVSAHRYDELLQAARIGVESDRVRVEMDLTPGIAVANAVLRDIDVNGDGVLSSTEQQRYAGRVLNEVTLRVDDSRPLRLALVGSSFPGPVAMRNGDAAISLRLDAEMPRLGGGRHHLSFRNDHATSNSVYLANAMVPASARLTVTGQRRDIAQRELVVDFTVRDAQRSRSGWAWAGFAGALLLAAAWTRRADRRSGRRGLS